jgi:hypothetical protein
MTAVNVNAARTTFVAVVPSGLRRHGNANDLHVMAETAMRRTTLDSIALARKAGAFHERREVLRHAHLAVCVRRAQEINAGERLPNCARMIVEEI